MQLLLVGYVTKAHGLSGEVVVEPHHADSPLWKPGITLHAVTRDAAGTATDRLEAAPVASYRLVACRKQASSGEIRWLCRLEGVADRDGAEALRGTHFGVDPALLPALADDEFYHHELRGFAVEDVAGRALGTVVGVLEGPAQDLLEVAPPAPAAPGKAPETFFVPFVGAIVTHVDRAQRRVIVDPPEGLVP